MIFRETSIAGALLVEPERHVDERGSFARLWCEKEFADRGVNPRVVQTSLSTNRVRGTVRGMHYSVPPHAEAKFVRCVRGAICDVLVDLRRASPTFLRRFAASLTADNAMAVYVPEGVAHGFQTTEDATDVLYQISEFYDPACARGVRHDDPLVAIEWPEPVRVISERDRSYPDFVAGAP